MTQVTALLRAAGKALRPPPVLSYSEWASQNVRLPSGQSAISGRWRPWKFQRIMLDLIGDPLIERVTIPKAARLGYTRSLVAAIAADAANDPCPIILLSPADDDARGMMTDEVDPTFEDSPALAGLMRTGRFDGKNTLTQRALMGGGSLKSLAARSPRNLRRHTARKVYCDEVDGYEITAEGDPIKLVEKRTQSYADRKSVIGSTPTLMETSIVWKCWLSSDQGVFEIQCPTCGGFFEVEWEHIQWPQGEPEGAFAACPCCGGVIEERYKAVAVENGRRRTLRPEVKGHAGFRLSALVSLQPGATWAILAAEYEEAKRGGPAAMQVFYNTVLGRPWSSALEHIDQHVLMSRREPFGLSFDPAASEWRADIPAEVLYITAGVDVQIDRVEVTILGWSRNQRFVLGHEVVWGATTLESTWNDLDALLQTRWRHPLGNEIGIEAVAVDSGDGNRTQFVYDFCQPRQDRRVMAIKGMGSARPVIEASKNRKHRRKGVNLHIIGVDQVKTDILTSVSIEPIGDNGLPSPGAIRFSDVLEAAWFEQLTSERRVIEYRAGKVKMEFKRIENRSAEALDATVYAIAIRNICRFDFDRREKDLTRGNPSKKAGGFLSSLKRMQGM